ncbi:DUF1173 domain-containing protein [Asaia sp. As-1742]|nr:DUF1173 domain-containing protein [Asaia sp. As-1742]
MRYHLARMPGSGPLHSANCPFHEPDIQRDGRSGYEQGVITPLPDGNLRIALESGLLVRATANEADCPALQQSACGVFPGHGRRQMSLPGLLHLLWEQSGLTTWRPEESRQRRSWGAIRQALERAAASVEASGTVLDRRLAMVGHGDADGPAILEDIQRDAGRDRRILLCGIVRRLDFEAARNEDPANPWSPRLEARFRLHFDGAPNFGLWLSGSMEMALDFERQFPWEWHTLQKHWSERGDARVVALVTTKLRRTVNGRATVGWVNHMTLMEVGPSYVPVASSHELALLTHLQEEHRIFRKPLRFDRTTELVHPDFELLDTRDPRGTPMEVYGLDTEEYRARRDIKEAHYRDVYGVGNWWSWNAALREPMPDLPLPQERIIAG